jgi:hypothetical protein
MLTRTHCREGHTPSGAVPRRQWGTLVVGLLSVASIHPIADKVYSRKPPIAPVLVVYPSRPGRSGFSLHRTGMMAMLHSAGPGFSRLRVLFLPAPREAGEYLTLRPFRAHSGARIAGTARLRSWWRRMFGIG